MRRAAVAFGAVAVAALAVWWLAARDRADGGKTFGTNAHLAPSEPDAVLRYADHPRGFAELRLPVGNGPFPLAVIFHGGCWKTGIADQRYMAPLATRWQREGVATLNVDYREVGDGGGWPGSFADWEAAAKLIDRVAARYPIDRARVTLVGHSAGTLPALWLAEARVAGSPIGAAPPVRARAAILLDGPIDVGAEAGAFDGLCEFSSVAPFMGGAPGAMPARYATIAPAAHPPQLDEALVLKAAMAGPPAAPLDELRDAVPHTVLRAERGASHFDIITPGNPAYDRNEAAILRLLRGG